MALLKASEDMMFSASLLCPFFCQIQYKENKHYIFQVISVPVVVVDLKHHEWLRDAMLEADSVHKPQISWADA